MRPVSDLRGTGLKVTMPILETRGLTKRFGGLVAVNSVDLSVEQGEIFAMIGPNARARQRSQPGGRPVQSRPPGRSSSTASPCTRSASSGATICRRSPPITPWPMRSAAGLGFGPIPLGLRPHAVTRWASPAPFRTSGSSPT